MEKQKQTAEECHQKLIQLLEKPERKIILELIDRKDQITDARSADSFFAGFRLAWRLAYELNIYERMRPLPTTRPVDLDAFSMLDESKG